MVFPKKIVATCIVGAVAVVGYSAYAFTASNTVESSAAGDGSATVSGYDVTDIAYTLNGTTYSNIDQVSFTIDPVDAGTTKAKLDGNWYDCVNTAGAVTCDTTSPQLTVTPLDSLEALVVQ
jgi:hypothetical protein